MVGLAGLRRRGALALGLATLLAACTSTAKDKDGNEVRTDSEPLERRFAPLGPLSDAHWLGVALGTTDARVPGPTDLRVVGFAQLRAGAVSSITGTSSQRGFKAAKPHQLPSELVQFMPEGARWVRSESFDRQVTGETYAGRFYFDAATDLVYFDTINPSVASSSGT
ncbi:hypothetical protein [Streptomyces sp. NBC_01013]|uniref:hypothetical protein n=1 Tax=Streptomyces sp. NBC_01013 TaxID=2903718 RepID=UPI00386F155F|nr:hypothetical protein OG538_00675 [Streptomyces sp. NBC_01013]